MNKILLLLMLMISTVATAQYKDDMTLASNQTVDLHLDYQTKTTSSPTPYGYESSRMSVGLGMFLGGATFIVAGMLTPSTYVGGSTTQKKPFIQQPKALPILSGALVMTIGGVISIGR
jgi:4-hydroxybenzoate polyprenyltransferase